jgi:predicted membrane protein
MKKEKAYETIIVLALASLISFLIFQKIWLVYLSVTLLVIPIASVKVSLVIAQIWFDFSFYLGVVMNHIIMFICFYIILIPLAFLQKLFGGNQILRKKESNSYFQRRDHLFTSEDIRKPW